MSDWPSDADLVDDYGSKATDSEEAARIRALIADPTYAPVEPWEPGHARYADPAHVRRLALQAVLAVNAATRDEAAKINAFWRDAGRVFVPSETRNDFVASHSRGGRLGWEDDAPTADVESSRLCNLAMAYLYTRRHYAPGALHALIKVHDRDPDALMFEHACLVLEAGLTADEIARCDETGQWPDEVTLRSLAALRGNR